MKQINLYLKEAFIIIIFLGSCLSAMAKGGGANVTITDNGTTVVLANGIIAATITKSSATVETMTYNGYDVLTGGYNGGQIYWSWNMPNYQNPSGCTYTITANPANNNGDYAEIKLHMIWNGSAATAAMDVDVYYSLPRGTQGLYASATLSHPASYPANPGGEWRMASYPGSTFDWLSVDSLRNRKMASLSDESSASVVTGAPKEVVLMTTGIYKNQYECKYDYSADFGETNVWGWSSTARNIGIWVTVPSKEYYNGGPMKRELMCHNSPTMLNMLGGQHYGMGGDLDIVAGESWQKEYGPFLIYCNSVPTGTTNAWKALWDDANAQAKTEQAAWPYTWYTNPNYIQENGRGTVTGKIVINDITNPTASSAGLWVGVAVTPISTTGITDFQLWAKNYQFWVKTDVNGNFTIPHVLPGIYNIYAFGPGAAGQMSKINYLTVTAGNTTALNNVVWVPERTAPTAWEIGIPDRSAKEFMHGSDWWTSNTLPSTNWAKFMDYPTEFPNNVNFTIGQSNIATDWNFVQNYDNTVQTSQPEWKVNFNLPSAPPAGSTSAVYVAAASSYGSALYVTVNGTNITSPSTGIYIPNASDAKVRKGIHGAFGDYRFTFASSLLHAGANTISFNLRITGGGTVGEVMYDYVRLETYNTSTWTGTNSTSWTDAGNWTSGVPTVATDATIANTVNKPVIAAASIQSLHSLIINSGASVALNGQLQVSGSFTNSGSIIASGGTIVMNGTVAQTIPALLFSTNTLQNLVINNIAGVTIGGALNITGVLTSTTGILNTGGYITLISNVNGTASVSQVTGSILGNIIIQHYVPGNSNWRTVSFPFTAATNITGVAGNTSLNNYVSSPAKAYYYTESSDNGMYGNSGNTNAGWNAIVSGTSISAAKGILLWGSATAQTLSMTGPINSGNLINYLSLSKTGNNPGWNLIANPYPSNISWGSLYNGNTSSVFGSNAVYRVNPTMGNGAYTFSVYLAGSAFSSVNGGSDVLENGSSYFVKAANNGANVNFAESYKISGSPNSTTGGVSLMGLPSNILKLMLKEDNQNSGDEVLVRFGMYSNVTDQYNSLYDAYDLGTFGMPDLSVIGNDTSRYCIYHGSALLPSSIERRKIILGMKNIMEGQYSITTNVLAALNNGNIAYLVDSYTGTAVKIVDGMNYKFEVTSDASSKKENRLSIVFNYNKETAAPNPASNLIILLNNPSPNNQIVLKVGGDYDRLNWQLIDMSGRQLQNGEWDNVTKGSIIKALLTQTIAAGVYFIRLQGNGIELKTIKWVK